MLKIIQENNKNKNINNVIKFVREKGPLSRIELSEQMKITQPTMTRIIEKLLEANILKEKGLGNSTGGRRPVLLEFNENCAYAVGVELGRSNIKLVVTNMNGELLSFIVKETHSNDTIENIVALVKENFNRIMDEAKIDPSLILGVGIGMPGPLNETKDGRISPPNFYDGKNVPLKSMLEKELQYPVTIDNDANVAALAEAWFGKGQELENFAYVMADVGIGSGLIINNDLYRGVHGEAGEIGHFTIDVFGRECTCGSYGCLETFVSIPVLMKKLRQQLKLAPEAERNLFGKKLELIQFDDINKAYEKESFIARSLLDEAGKYLGVGVTNLINFYAPQAVVIGGKVGTAQPIILERIKEIVSKRAIGSKGKKTPVVTSDLKEGVVIGAAALVIHRTFYAMPVLSY